MLRSMLGYVLAALCAVGLEASPASATLALNQAAAFAVVPITVLFQPSQWSYATFTNASDQNVTLHLNFIDGRFWRAIDYSCPVTAQETVLFVFRPTGNFTSTSSVDFKCSIAFSTPNGVAVASTPVTLDLPFRIGLLTAAVESPPGTTTSANVLVGDWLTADFSSGYMFGAEAITFQGLSALAQDGDRDYRFDGQEYASFPAQVAANFIAPTQDIGVRLILFTLDGTTGSQPAGGGEANPVQLRGNVYNDREESQSFNLAFDCFTIRFLTSISPAFAYTGPGGFMSTAGHFDLTPAATGAGDPAHEFEFGNGDGVRKRPVMGWLVEIFTSGAQVPDVAPPGGAPSPPFPNTSFGVRARALGTSVTSFTPLAGDTPTFSSN